MEEDLVAPLFARTTRSARLTRAGKLFLEHVPRVFTVLEQARDSEKAAANGFHSQSRCALGRHFAVPLLDLSGVVHRVSASAEFLPLGIWQVLK